MAPRRLGVFRVGVSYFGSRIARAGLIVPAARVSAEAVPDGIRRHNNRMLCSSRFDNSWYVLELSGEVSFCDFSPHNHLES